MGWESEIELPEFWGFDATDGPQPRERSVPCAFCGQPTFNFDAVCDSPRCRNRSTESEPAPTGAATGHTHGLSRGGLGPSATKETT